MNTKTKEYFEFNEFSSNINVRLQDAYYFVNDLVENDIEDITFNLKAASNSKGFFNVKVTENAFQNDDLVTIKDEKSLVYGQPFEYTFGRKNREPALYYVKDNVLNLPANTIIDEPDLFGNSEKKAEDPDEDSIVITVQAQLADPNLPTVLDKPQINFKIEANDGSLSDYQIITVNRI